MVFLDRRSFVALASATWIFIQDTISQWSEGSQSPPSLPSCKENWRVWGLIDAAIHRHSKLPTGVISRQAKFVPAETMSVEEFKAVLRAADEGLYDPSDVPVDSHPLYDHNRGET